MKKNIVLLISLFSMLCAYAQQKQNTNSIISDPALGEPVIKTASVSGGYTMYDYQTSNSMAKKLVAYPDGTVGMTWIMGLDYINGWWDRGAGYNYFNGTSWGPIPSESIQSDRCGGASYAALGANGEINVSYTPVNSPDYDLVISRRAEKGIGDWDEYLLSGPGSVGLVWPTMVTNGPNNTYIHILAQTYGTEYNGQPTALLYYRSLDGGETWDIQHQLFDELGPEYFTEIGRDQYAWAEPKGETIAFCCGFSKESGFIMKSDDNGESWVATQVYSNPFSPYQLGPTPNFGAGDGTQACAIDGDGNVHVVFGRMVHKYDETGASFYFPLSEGIVYWREGMDMLDTNSISSYLTEFLLNSGNLIVEIVYNGNELLSDVKSYGGKSITSQPQINIDENNNIFVIWSALAPGYDNSISNYRHIFGRTSTDGGSNWSDIKDYTDGIHYFFSECVYPVMAGNFYNGMANVVFMEDNEPGISEWLGNHLVGDNYIKHMQILLDFSVGIHEHNTSAVSISEVFPNPMSETSRVAIELPSDMNVSYYMTTITGQVALIKNLGIMKSGHWLVDIESNTLSRGLYFLSFDVGGIKQTQKVFVK